MVVAPGWLLCAAAGPFPTETARVTRMLKCVLAAGFSAGQGVMKGRHKVRVVLDLAGMAVSMSRRGSLSSELVRAWESRDSSPAGRETCIRIYAFGVGVVPTKILQTRP